MSVTSTTLIAGRSRQASLQLDPLSLDDSPRESEARQLEQEVQDAPEKVPLALPLEVSPPAPSLLDRVREMVRTGALLRGHGDELNSLAAGTCGTGGTCGSGSVTPTEQMPEVAKLDFAYFEQTLRRVRLLGRGAFGEVWHCKSLKDGKEYAVKVVRFRGGGSTGSRIEKHVIREAQTLALMNHPNVVGYHRAWIETAARGCAGPDYSQGDASCSTRAPSWPSTPAAPFAPPPSPAVRPSMPALQLPEGGPLTEGSRFTYDGGSCGSGVVFFEWNEDEAAPSPVASVREGMPSPDSASRDEVPSMPGSFVRGRSASALPEDTDHSSEYTGTLYLQVELCKDTTLQGWIADRNWRMGDGSLTDKMRPWARKARNIFLQCVRALAHVHSRRCVHRDVKPSNILFACKDSAIRLSDFGLAKALDAEQETFVCGGSGSPLPSPERPKGARGGSRGTVGTPSYASPEQLAGKQLDTSTDIYSLGLVLAEIICPVMTQMERAAVLEGLRHRRQLPIGAVASFPKLADLAVRMTDPDPAKRPSAVDVLKEARKVCRDVLQKRRSPPDADFNGCDGTVGKAEIVQKIVAPAGRHRHHRPGRNKCSGAPFFVGTGTALWRRRSQHRQQLCRRVFVGAQSSWKHSLGHQRSRGSSQAK
eukprot:gb/GFBE01060338.1/.p1 GENE.gb/GFBE01060338.1/~~gb/GFBE01060338.1/.p1  ORF type:complete len:648 (+),score=99.28 gb/GFBE01060338.1/:1-1944(+)